MLASLSSLTIDYTKAELYYSSLESYISAA